MSVLDLFLPSHPLKFARLIAGNNKNLTICFYHDQSPVPVTICSHTTAEPSNWVAQFGYPTSTLLTCSVWGQSIMLSLCLPCLLQGTLGSISCVTVFVKLYDIVYAEDVPLNSTKVGAWLPLFPLYYVMTYLVCSVLRKQSDTRFSPWMKSSPCSLAVFRFPLAPPSRLHPSRGWCSLVHHSNCVST